MSYEEFLSRIDEFIGCVVEFTSRFKSDGKIFKTQRYVWDRKEFAEPKEDSLIEVLKVRVIRKVNLDKSVTGIVAVR